ncbi:hypothetical protein EC968_010565 [Mortierella alpina]|nr:hypothetical protein EC968_010565 [Mortierella alpina]
MSSQTPCRFFLAGNCRKGSRCRFYHDGFSSIPAAIIADATGEETSISPGHRGEAEAAVPLSTSTSSSSNTRPAYAAVRPCQWYMAGYCLRGDSCWFSHDRAWIDPTYRRNDTVAVDDSEDEDQGAAAVSSRNREDTDNETESQKCAICFEEPSTFGLLASLTLLTWRAKDVAPDMHPQDRSNSVTKACPNCRTPSLYIVPSSYFPTSPEQKEVIIRNYKEATARRPCKHFRESGSLRWCPFGDSCHFAHQDENGEPCKVNPESDPRRRRQRQQRHHHYNHHHPHHTHFGSGRNRAFAGRHYPPRSSRYDTEETLELRGFFANLTGLEDVSEIDIETLTVLLAELARPLESNYSSMGHDLVDLDEDEFDDDDGEDWEDDEDDDDDNDDDEDDDDEDEDDDDAFEDHYRYFLHHHHHHLNHHDDF